MNSRTLLIRADASVSMGTGHVMRCIALAQAWQDDGGRVVFATAQNTPAVRLRLAAESCEDFPIAFEPGGMDDAEQLIAIAGEQTAAWVVVDGYQFDAKYQQTLKQAGVKVLVLDDYGHASHYWADLVLNQNLGAAAAAYQARERETRLLLGPEFCLLRHEFTSWRDWKRTIATVGRKILVTIGGSDPNNVTSVVLEALTQFSDAEAIIVVGGSNPHLEELRAGAKACGDRVKLLENVSDMPQLMAWADLAISGAGSTCWEECRLQLPMAIIDIAENQTGIAKALAAEGAAVHLGGGSNVNAKDIALHVKRLLASEQERRSLSESCGALVDGRGCERVLEAMSRR